MALTASGTVACWGDNSAGQGNVPSGLTNVVAISAGDYFNLALTKSGKVVAWGNNTYGQTNVPAGLSNVVAISAGWSENNGTSYGLAVTSAGNVVGWGGNRDGQLTFPGGLSNVVAVAAGWYHSLALAANGSVFAWGNNGYGQTSIPSGLSNVVAIAAGNVNSLAPNRQRATQFADHQPTDQQLHSLWSKCHFQRIRLQFNARFVSMVFQRAERVCSCRCLCPTDREFCVFLGGDQRWRRLRRGAKRQFCWWRRLRGRRLRLC